MTLNPSTTLYPGTTVFPDSGTETAPPTIPVIYAVTSDGLTATIEWNPSTDDTGVASYRVRRDGLTLSGADAVTSTSFIDTTIAPLTSYSYTVSAIDAAGNRSAESAPFAVTTPATPPPSPDPALISSPLDTSHPMVVSVYDDSYNRLGQIPDYVSCSVTWQELGVGSGELVVNEDSALAPVLLTADVEVVPVVTEVNGERWSGRVVTAALERTGPVGSGVITATLVDDFIWLRSMLASQGGPSSSLTGMPEFDTRTGPAASVAADFINAAATRLGVPVVAIKPSVDASPIISLNARMKTLADLLLVPLKLAGVSLSVTIWLPGDEQPDDVLTPLTIPTVVCRPRVLAEKPWLQWTDAMTNITRLNFQVNHATAYRAIVGLGGEGATRVYDQVIDTEANTGLGPYALPETYVEASDATLGSQSTARGWEGLASASGTASAAFTVADASPWVFGDDYVVGDIATVVVGQASWRQRITRVTASDDRTGGLTFTPLVGEQSPEASGDEMMVRALAQVAEGLRALQAGK